MLFDKCDSSLVRSIVADSEFSSLFSEAEIREARTRFDNDLINFPDLNEVEENRAKKIKMIGKLLFSDDKDNNFRIVWKIVEDSALNLKDGFEERS